MRGRLFLSEFYSNEPKLGQQEQSTLRPNWLQSINRQQFVFIGYSVTVNDQNITLDQSEISAIDMASFIWI